MKLSIITITYNDFDNLRKTIDNVSSKRLETLNILLLMVVRQMVHENSFKIKRIISLRGSVKKMKVFMMR